MTIFLNRLEMMAHNAFMLFNGQLPDHKQELDTIIHPGFICVQYYPGEEKRVLDKSSFIASLEARPGENIKRKKIKIGNDSSKANTVTLTFQEKIKHEDCPRKTCAKSKINWTIQFIFDKHLPTILSSPVTKTITETCVSTTAAHKKRPSIPAALKRDHNRVQRE